MRALEPRDFGVFFEAVHGYSPFPWQRRLVVESFEMGRLPAVLDLPTGAGKTAALDIGLFLLALDAHRKPTEQRFPRRIIIVVDRRIVVDQASERAHKIRKALESPTDPVLMAVRERLLSLSGDGSEPFAVATLRGGIPGDDDWARRPDMPLLAASTVDQVGSRLLFRGYGVSNGMRPVHAGLLGSDTLYLLDEVHLSEPFRQTLAALSEVFETGWHEVDVPRRWQVVEMSATVLTDKVRFTLGSEDLENQVLARRLASSKPVTVSLAPSAAAKQLASWTGRQAMAMLESTGQGTLFTSAPKVIAVIVNRIERARLVHRWLVGKKGIEATLLTGRMRPMDRDCWLSEYAHRLAPGRDRAMDTPLIVVATQCIEAGADFDFDGLLTEVASLDALRQRFGRVDRLGDRTAAAGSSPCVIFTTARDLKEDDPIYGAALAETWRWLSEQEAVDFGIGQLQLPEVLEPFLAPKPDAPVMLPAHLDAWVQTRPAPWADPDIALWLHGPGRDRPEVRLVWRGDLTQALLEGSEEVALQRMAAIPPSGLEALSLPLDLVIRWLGVEDGRAKSATWAQDVPAEERPKPYDGQIRPCLAWRGDESVRVAQAGQLRPGDMLVVPVEYGGLAFGNWSFESVEPVVDIAETATLAHRDRVVVRLHPGLLAGELTGGELPRPPAQPSTPEDLEFHDDAEALREWLSEAHGLEWSRSIRERLEHLEVGLNAGGTDHRRWLWLPGAEGDPGYYLISEGKSLSDPDTSTDAASFVAHEVLLDDHLAGVGALAGQYAMRCGLSDALVRALRVSGNLHDLGKADLRFQALLHGGDVVRVRPDRLIAKSGIRASDRAARQRAQRLSGYPVGTRHELMSVALLADGGVAALPDDVDHELVRYLIGTHHGWCRPFPPPVGSGEPQSVSIRVGETVLNASSDHRLGRIDSEIPERFWSMTRKYGWHGLARLEAMLRLADHRQSQQETGNG